MLDFFEQMAEHEKIEKRLAGNKAKFFVYIKLKMPLHEGLFHGGWINSTGYGKREEAQGVSMYELKRRLDLISNPSDLIEFHAIQCGE
jgi:hypothetical protein